MGKKKSEAKQSTVTEEVRNNPFAALAPTAAAKPKKAAEPSEPTVTPPKNTDPISGKLVLRREKKGRGGKTVTRLSGVAPDALEDIAKQIKKGLGCGALVEGDDIVLLGSLVDRAAEWLEKQGAKKVVRGN